MFWSKLCKSNWNSVWNLAFAVFTLTYFMEHVWKSSIRIGIFQRATQRARILLTGNTQSGGSSSVNYYYLLYCKSCSWLVGYWKGFPDSSATHSPRNIPKQPHPFPGVNPPPPPPTPIIIHKTSAAQVLTFLRCGHLVPQRRLLNSCNVLGLIYQWLQDSISSESITGSNYNVARNS